MIQKTTIRIHKFKKIISTNRYYIECRYIHKGLWKYGDLEITEQEFKNLKDKKEFDVINFVLEKLKGGLK